MEQHHQITIEKLEDKSEVQDNKSTPPPSSSSSPSHEFSFTISLHSAPKTPPQFAIDLSPADDIFFHGHLLPLHLLSHLPISPRASTTSIDHFSQFPIKELFKDQNTISKNVNLNKKSKTFSLFGSRKSRKERENDEKEKENHKINLNFDMGRVWKRYVRKVRPLFLFKWRREKIKLERENHSFSGNLSFRESTKPESRGRKWGFSAPASMRTSPNHSGLLVAKATVPCSTSNSTMEELQAAIQAAIAHCKNSIAVEEKLS